MRLQKLLAQAGYGARRKCEQLIIDGRVRINDRVARLGENVEPGDDVRLDGEPVPTAEETIYIALHKPAGYASDLSDPHGKTMFELVDVPQRLFGVGRLDKDSTGLILLTNDGEFAYRLTHPKFEHVKEYRVWVEGVPDEATLQQWRGGVLLEGERTKTAPCDVWVVETHPSSFDSRSGDSGGASLLGVTMHEGRKRQIRRIATLLGHPVIALARVRVGNVRLGTLQSGKWRKLTDREVSGLLSLSPADSPDQHHHDRRFRPHARTRHSDHRD